MSMEQTTITRRNNNLGSSHLTSEAVTQQLARPAGLLRAISGTPAGTSIQTHRRGSFLVLVVGTLALLAVITIVYVALGNQDARTKATVIRRDQFDDVPAQIGQYTADVIASDLFSTTIDGGMTQQGASILPNLRRETDDAPGIAHRAGDLGSPNEEYTLTSERDPLAATNIIDTRRYFTPQGTIFPTLEQDLASTTPTVANQFVLNGAYSGFRLPSSDPWLAPHSPSFINFGAGSSTGAVSDFVSVPDWAFLDQQDWSSISNVAPTGLFVNLANLRNNFGAFNNVSAINANEKPGMGYGKSLLTPDATTGVDRFRFIDSNQTVWGQTLAIGTDDAIPYYWSVMQRGAFRPSRIADGQPDVTETPGNDLFKGYQWADADGDGMLDSRWWEFAHWQDDNGANVVLPGEATLPEFAGNFRWFVATRVVDLSGLVNVNFAGDLMASPRQQLFTNSPTSVTGANMTMPLGMTPADIDLRRLLTQFDTYANFDPNVNGSTSNPAGYEGFPDLSGEPIAPSIPNALEYNGPTNRMSESRAYIMGTSAYLSLQLANESGRVLGLQVLDPATSQYTALYETDQSAAGTPPESDVLTFADRELVLGGLGGVGINFTDPDVIRNSFGRRGWQTFMYPSLSYAGGNFFPPYGVDTSGAIGTHYGWIEWSARRTLNYIDQSRKVYNTSSNVMEDSSVGRLRFDTSDLAELLTYRTINDPSVTSNLEVAMGARDQTPLPAGAGVSDNPLSLDVLRSNRELPAETRTFDPWNTTDVLTDENAPMVQALRRLHTDVRKNLTTISLSRPLRTTSTRQPSTSATPQQAQVSQLQAGDAKINARAMLDLPARPVGDYSSPTPNVKAAETTASLLYEGYFDALAPYASIDIMWNRSNTDYNKYRTLFYGYRGPELAALTAGTLAVNMVDLADGPITAPLLVNGPDVYVEDSGVGQGRSANNTALSQTQPIRPGTSDPFDQPTIRTQFLTDDPAVRAALDGSVSNAADGIAAAFPTLQRTTDITGGVPLDNLDLLQRDVAGTVVPQGKLAPVASNVIAPVVKLYGIEAQPFVTQVTTMTVYFDNWINSQTGFNTVPSQVQFVGPENTAASPATTAVLGDNKIQDGDTINRTEVLFNLVAFKITNPFDRDIVMGRPLLSDVAPNSASSPVIDIPELPDSPIQLVVDPSVMRSNQDIYFPARPDRLPIFSRGWNWATGTVAGNGIGLIGPGALGAGRWSNTNQTLGIYGSFSRGDTIDVASTAFLGTGSTSPLPVDSISDFHYVRFGNRTYMLMSLHEQQLYSGEDVTRALNPGDVLGTGPNNGRQFSRPDLLVADSSDPADDQKYVDVPTAPGVKITMNPIRIPAGQTVVCYALSESPNRIRDRLRGAAGRPDLRIASADTPADGGSPTQPYGTDALNNLQPYVDLRPFIQRLIENQIARSADPSITTDLFNPNGAYWVPMIWEGGGPTPPAGFTPSRLQNLGAYVNPIPSTENTELAAVTRERTVTLWRTVREQRRPWASPVATESIWLTVPSSPAINLDWNGGTHASSDAWMLRRPVVGLSRLNSNNYANDQMVDRLRIPNNANLWSQLDENIGGEATRVVAGGFDPSVGPDGTTPATDDDADRKGVTMTLWASVMRPSDPRTNQDIADPFAPFDRIPKDVLPAYCLEAKYWEDPTSGAVTSWNIFRESESWNRYRTEGATQLTITFPNADFGIGLADDTGRRPWKGHAKDLREWIGRQTTYAIDGTATPTNPATFVDNDGFKDFLWQAPNNIVARGYLDPVAGTPLAPAAPTRSFVGTIDQKPNATIVTQLFPLGTLPTPGATPGAPLPTGFLTFADMYPQVTMDADAARGRTSNNFYRDVDVRRAAGAIAGSPFSSQDQYTRWVSILRPADMLRPLGVGPLEVPLQFPPGGGVPTLRVFNSVTITVPELQAVNARYTTLSEALASAMGYEKRVLSGPHAGMQGLDINLLRSPYMLPPSPTSGFAGETNALGAPSLTNPYLLKRPGGSRSPSTGSLQPGDDSTDVMLFDRGNLRLDHFVPFIDAETQDTVLDPDTVGINAERAVGTAIPLAQMVLEEFETPATDPANPTPQTGENTASAVSPRQGLININTAPVEVLRLLPGVTPRSYEEQSLTNAGAPRPSTQPLTGPGLGDPNWFEQVVDVRPILPLNQNIDLAAGIAGYRDMVPVLLSRTAQDNMDAIRAANINSFPNASGGPTFLPVVAPFLPDSTATSDTDPFTGPDGNNARAASRIMGIGNQPGFRSVGEVLSARSRVNESVPATTPSFISRWPSATATLLSATRGTPWAAAPYNIDSLGYDRTLANVGTPPVATRLDLNSTFDEIDPQAGSFGTTPFDDPYQLPAPDASRIDPTLATAGATNEFDEKLIAANNFLNTVTNRSDVFAVWFTLAGFQRSDVEGLSGTDPILPSVQRRFLMVVDRSNVVSKGTKPRILLMKEVPMPRE